MCYLVRLVLIKYWYYIIHISYQPNYFSELYNKLYCLSNCDLEFISNGTSNEYDLQSVYNGNGFIGIISDLSQVYLTMYDTAISPYTYTGSENIDITYNQSSLTFPLKINDEVVLNPRLN